MLTIVVLLMIVALYAMFELGRFTAGYDAMQAAQERGALQTQIDQLKQAEREMRVQLAAAEENRVADLRERTDLSRSIGELQAQVERQQQDVEFYRGLAQPGRPAVANAIPVRVEQLHIAPTSMPQQFELRFSLGRMQRASDQLTGTVAITVEGTKEGAVTSVDLAALTNGKSELPFNFRYTTSFDQMVTLPAAFKPDRVTIEIRTGRKGATPNRQTFVWNIDPA